MNETSTGSESIPWSVVGHEWAIRLLQGSAGLSAQGPRHAYLLLGPSQIGKTTLAQAFAKALLCTDPDQRPCGSCRACRLMEKIGHPDFRMVQPTDRTGEVDRSNGLLRVEQATEVIHAAQLHPLEGRYKFFLIQDMHHANDSFSNKLLKTLEEPPAHVLLCLTADNRSNLLPTIVSRCQVMELRPLDPQVIEQALINHWQASHDQAALWARLSNGRLGWAVNQLQSSDKGADRRGQIAELRQLIQSDHVDRLKFSQLHSANRDNERLFPLLALWLSWWRDIFLVQAGCVDSCNNVDYRQTLIEDAENFDPESVRQYLQTLRRIDGYLRHTVNTGLALDVLLLQLPHPNRNQI